MTRYLVSILPTFNFFFDIDCSIDPVLPKLEIDKHCLGWDHIVWRELALTPAQRSRISNGRKKEKQKKAKKENTPKGRPTARPNSFGNSPGVLPAAKGFLHEAIEIVSRRFNQLVIISGVMPCLFIMEERRSGPTDDNTPVRSRDQVVIYFGPVADNIRVRKVWQWAAVGSGNSSADATAGHDFPGIFGSDSGSVPVRCKNDFGRFDWTPWGCNEPFPIGWINLGCHGCDRCCSL